MISDLNHIFLNEKLIPFHLNYQVIFTNIYKSNKLLKLI